MGSTDCDPASSEIALRIVKAITTYSAIADDGLTKEWHGNFVLNPPYSRQLIDRFVDKLLAEIAAGHVTAAILIVHSKTDAKWFYRAARALTP